MSPSQPLILMGSTCDFQNAPEAQDSSGQGQKRHNPDRGLHLGWTVSNAKHCQTTLAVPRRSSSRGARQHRAPLELITGSAAPLGDACRQKGGLEEPQGRAAGVSPVQGSSSLQALGRPDPPEGAGSARGVAERSPCNASGQRARGCAVRSRAGRVCGAGGPRRATRSRLGRWQRSGGRGAPGAAPAPRLRPAVPAAAEAGWRGGGGSPAASI